MFQSNEPISIFISSLNQYAYCPRRCALIHVEQEFQDNIHTARGTAEHERVDRVAHETSREGARIEFALPVWSDRLGLTGKCDAVEFWPDGTIYPVEHKHGARKKWLNDDIQLSAQAMCLEEMTGKHVMRGAIYHRSSRRRREVEITGQLRLKVEETVTAIRAMMASGKIPPPVFDARCKECSLKEICSPEPLAATDKLHTLRKELFLIEEEG